MNIFEEYLNKIKKVLLDLSKNSELILPHKLMHKRSFVLFPLFES